MRIVPGNAQHLGSRKEQQDDFGFSNIDDVNFARHAGVLAVITDGMGGLEKGREASLIAKQTMLQEYESKDIHQTIPQTLVESLSVANAKVLEMAKQAGLEGETGTTLAAAVIKDDELYWISVGDSRIYLYRRGQLTQITTDHDYARELAREVDLGLISPEEAANHPQRHALTNYLGLPVLEEMDRNEEPLLLEAGDCILLCSDGLYKTISEEEIVKLIDGDHQNIAEDLIEAALLKEKKNQDNITVATLSYEPEPEIDGHSNQSSFIELYAKPFIIIFIILLCLGSMSYLAALHYKSSKVKTDDIPIESKSTTPDAKGPPLVQGESNITSPVLVTRRGALQEPRREERLKLRNKQIHKKSKQGKLK